MFSSTFPLFKKIIIFYGSKSIIIKRKFFFLALMLNYYYGLEFNNERNEREKYLLFIENINNMVMRKNNKEWMEESAWIYE